MVFSWNHKDSFKANIYFRRAHTVAKKSKTCVNVTLIRIGVLLLLKKCFRFWCKKVFPYLSKLKGLNEFAFSQKRKALWFKCAQNILLFCKSPKSVWQCFHFFYFNLFESFQRSFVEISSFLRKKCFQTKICVKMTSGKLK